MMHIEQTYFFPINIDKSCQQNRTDIIMYSDN